VAYYSAIAAGPLRPEADCRKCNWYELQERHIRQYTPDIFVRVNNDRLSSEAHNPSFDYMIKDKSCCVVLSSYKLYLLDSKRYNSLQAVAISN